MQQTQNSVTALWSDFGTVRTADTFLNEGYFAQHVTFASAGCHDSIVEISEKHCEFGAWRA